MLHSFTDCSVDMPVPPHVLGLKGRVACGTPHALLDQTFLCSVSSGWTAYRMVGSQSSGWSSNATALMLQAMATAFNVGERHRPVLIRRSSPVTAAGFCLCERLSDRTLIIVSLS